MKYPCNPDNTAAAVIARQKAAKVHYLRARRLASILTQYDEKQSRKRGWNSHGLALYFQALESWESDPLSVTDPIRTLADYFTTNPSNPHDFCLTPIRQFVREIHAGKI